MNTAAILSILGVTEARTFAKAFDIDLAGAVRDEVPRRIASLLANRRENGERLGAAGALRKVVKLMRSEELNVALSTLDDELIADEAPFTLRRTVVRKCDIDTRRELLLELCLRQADGDKALARLAKRVLAMVARESHELV